MQLAYAPPERRLATWPLLCLDQCAVRDMVASSVAGFAACFAAINDTIP
jgi:hypothetical protein